jgi:glycine/D-amino acid oxidase-like deaminating enzyme
MDSTIEDTLKLSLQEAGVSMTQYEETEQKQVEEAQRISEMASLQAELIEKARQVSEEEQLKKALQASIEHQKAFEEQEMKVEDPELAAAVAASLQEAPVGVYSFDEDEEIRRAMELSYQEYASTSIASSTTKEKQQQQEDFEDMDELQRAIQASLQEK